MENKKITFNPDDLNLTKKDLVDFLGRCIDEWKNNLRGNFKFIVAGELMRAQVKITPEFVLKEVWSKIIQWFYDLNWENAKQDKTDSFMKLMREMDKEKNDQ